MTPQKRAAIPDAAQMGAGSPRSCPITQPKVAPIHREGTISPPRKPTRMVMAVRRIFQRKSRGTRGAFFCRPLDQLVSGAHIVCCSEDKRDNDHSGGADSHTDVGILQPAAADPADCVKNYAEQDADNCASHGYDDHFQAGDGCKFRNPRYMKVLRVYPEAGGKLGSDQ